MSFDLDSALEFFLFTFGYAGLVLMVTLYIRTRVRSATKHAMFSLWLYDLQRDFGEFPQVQALLTHITDVYEEQPHRTLNQLLTDFRSRFS